MPLNAAWTNVSYYGVTMVDVVKVQYGGVDRDYKNLGTDLLKFGWYN